MRCNAEFYYVGKIRRIGIGRPSLQRGVVLNVFTASRGNTFVGGACALPSALLVDYVLCRNESSEKKKEDLTHILRLLAKKVNNDQQYRKKVRTTTL